MATITTTDSSSKNSTCVRDKILAVINDIELISKELIDAMLVPKHARGSSSSIGGHSSLMAHHSTTSASSSSSLTSLEHNQIAELLVSKDKELKRLLKLAREQEEIESKTNELKAEVDQQDDEIRQLQKHLKEAEHVLATSIFQAKQKLALINKANERQLSSEELIKYAHKISAANAVAAPYNWILGDPRRPYPTDIEMRAGWLGQVMHDPSALTAPMIPSQVAGAQTPTSMAGPSTGPHMVGGMPGGPPMGPSGMPAPYSWQQQAGGPGTPSDIKPNMSTLPPLPPGIDIPGGRGVKNESLEDVEVMSTDSSSSSSSDSQ